MASTLDNGSEVGCTTGLHLGLAVGAGENPQCRRFQAHQLTQWVASRLVTLWASAVHWVVLRIEGDTAGAVAAVPT